MNPITNSRIKEGFRLKNESDAGIAAYQIRSATEVEINQLQFKKKHKATLFVIIGIILGFYLSSTGLEFSGFCIGVAIGLGLWSFANMRVKTYNQHLEDKKNELHANAEARINDIYYQADQQTLRQINAYDAEVKQYTQKVLGNRDTIKPMVDHVTNMFQRMVSHADAGAHKRFIEADFIYTVSKTGISYSYQSSYINPQDDYNFNRERYRDLKSDPECEGLAQALAKLTIQKMKSLYPANSITSISVDHNDACVTMHFKGANKNFIPARDII